MMTYCVALTILQIYVLGWYRLLPSCETIIDLGVAGVKMYFTLNVYFDIYFFIFWHIFLMFLFLNAERFILIILKLCFMGPLWKMVPVLLRTIEVRFSQQKIFFVPQVQNKCYDMY